jgi:hypothetical protein
MYMNLEKNGRRESSTALNEKMIFSLKKCRELKKIGTGGVYTPERWDLPGFGMGKETCCLR